MTNTADVITVEEMAEELGRELVEIRSGELKREDALVRANHAGKYFKAISLLLQNAELRKEVPDFALLSNRNGSGCGPVTVRALSHKDRAGITVEAPFTVT